MPKLSKDPISIAKREAQEAMTVAGLSLQAAARKLRSTKPAMIATATNDCRTAMELSDYAAKVIRTLIEEHMPARGPRASAPQTAASLPMKSAQ